MKKSYKSRTLDRFPVTDRSKLHGTNFKTWVYESKYYVDKEGYPIYNIPN